jgi:hypothetical protein
MKSNSSILNREEDKRDDTNILGNMDFSQIEELDPSLSNDK